MRLKSRQLRARERKGSALVFALVVATLTAGFCLIALEMTAATSGRQAHSVDAKAAFYVSEAGLAEAYHGLTTGKSGQLGSIEEPAAFGGGLVWVDATEIDDRFVRLESTGLLGSGRSTLSVTVERVEEVIGIFSDEGIDLQSSLLLDGFDSSIGEYDDQVVGGQVTIDPDWPYLHIDEANGLLFFEAIFYRFTAVEGNTYTYDTALDPYTEPSLQGGAIDPGDFMDDDWESDFEQNEYPEVLEWFKANPPGEAPPSGGGVVSGILGQTTGGGGKLGSNGNISLGDTSGVTIEVYGDVSFGLDGTVASGAGTSVTGVTTERSGPLELSPVQIPSTPLLPGVRHDSAVPMIIPPSTIGYESLVVAPGSEVVIQGPATVVLTVLQLEDGSVLTIENGAGEVELFVEQVLDFAAGSSVYVEADTPDKLIVQIGEGGTAQLNATSDFYGLIYAPGADITITSPFEVFGVLVANSLDIGPGSRLHLDNGCATSLLPRLVSWRIAQIPQAVAGHTIDPRDLFGIKDDDEVLDMQDAQETTSWMMTLDYFDLDGALQTFSGPLEAFDVSDVSSYDSLPELKAPTADLEGVWMMDMDYEDRSKVPGTFNGTVEDFEAQLSALNIGMVFRLDMTPPPGVTAAK